MTQRSVCTTPPRRRTSAASPWVMAALPPSTTGQPTPWPSAVSRRPKADVNGAVSGSMECAAAPAEQRPRRVGAEAPRGVADRGRADQGEPGQRQRVAGHAAHRAQHVGDDPVEPVHQRSHQLPVRRRVPAEVRRRLVDAPVQRGGPRRRPADGRRPPRAGAAPRRGRAGPGSGRRVRPPTSGAPTSRRRGGTPRASAPRCASRPRRSARPRRPRRRAPPGPA